MTNSLVSTSCNDNPIGSISLMTSEVKHIENQLGLRKVALLHSCKNDQTLHRWTCQQLRAQKAFQIFAKEY